MKRVSIALLCVMCGVILFTSCKNQDKHRPDTDNPLFKDPALKGITEKIGQHPTDAALYYQRGQLLHKMDQDTLALKDYQRAAKLDSTNAEYFSAAGDLLFNHKDISGSIPYLERAVALNPNDPRAHLKIARLFLFTKDYRKTFTEINTVLKQNAYNPEAYWIKGLAYKDMHDTAHAISSFQTAVQVAPDFRDAVIQLGEIYSSKKDTVALQYFHNAFRLDTTDVFPLFARGVFYQNLNNFPKAKEEYKNCITHDNQYADAYFNLGYIYLQEDSTEKARRQYDFVTKVEPNNAKAYYSRGLCSEIMKNKMEAINDYRQALVFDTSYTDAKKGLHRLGAK